MDLIYILVILGLFIGCVFYISSFDYKKLLSNHYFIIIFTGFFIRLIAMYAFPAFMGDVNGFKNMAIYIYDSNPLSFYSETDFSAYPPLYVFILYFIGFLNSIFKFTFEGSLFTFIIKFPAILADVVAAVFIYKLIYRIRKKETALLISLLYSLNPAVFIISSIWGQYEGIYALLMLISVYFITEKDPVRSGIFYVLTIMARPVSIIFLPIYIFFIIEFLREKNQIKNKGKIIAFALFSSAFIFALFLLPFYSSIDLKRIYDDVSGVLYPYATVNAYNLFAFMKGNWLSLTDTDFDYVVVSNILFTISVLLSLFFLAFSKGKYKYYFSIGFLNLCYFMFTVRMHERYMFLTLLFILVAYAYKKNKKLLFLYIGFSVTYFLNCADIINLSLNDNNIELISYSLSIISFVNLLLSVGTIYLGYKNSDGKEESLVERMPEPIITFNYDNVVIEKPDEYEKFNKKDFIYMAGMTLIYGIIAFYNLGNREAPISMFVAPENENTEIVYEFDEPKTIERIQLHLGPRNDKKIKYYASSDGVNWHTEFETDYGSVFSWRDTTKKDEDDDYNVIPISLTGKFFKMEIINKDDKEKTYIMEMALRDQNDEIIEIDLSKLNENEQKLFDEQDLVPKAYNFKSSTYFDEVYYARTAFEMINGLDCYEWTHPQLGKVFITEGVKIFGMNPFGWRFSGTFFGVLMLPVLYVFARRMLKSSNWALFATILFAFDFMHFTQTRISTIDTYITFFVILMYYYMFKYTRMSFYYTPFKKTLVPLLLSGLFMGMGVASKWPGVYAGIGLALIFFYTMFKRYREYIYAKNNNIEEITKVFKKHLIYTLGACVIFFVVIPVIIYFVSYIPYYQADFNSNFTQKEIFNRGASNNGLINYVIYNQQRMFEYHSHLNDTHPYSSSWWQWLIDIRPIAFYFGDVFDSLGVEIGSMREGISSFGNPAVWWVGLVSMFFLVAKFSETKSRSAAFLIVAYLAQLLPWTLINTRTTFIYHYFPCIPFLVIAIAYFFRDYVSQKNKKLTFIYAFVVILLFGLFYPVISGFPVKMKYVDYVLRWFSSWWLI